MNKFKVGDIIKRDGFRNATVWDVRPYEYYIVFGDGSRDWHDVDHTDEVWKLVVPRPDSNEEKNAVSPHEDAVNHPAHYTSDPSGVECIQVTRHRNFSIGNAIKYLWRAGLKKDASKADIVKQVEDLNKAIFYIKDEIERLQEAK